jgi:methylated-DNA-[protein]-cysteine S-methyltransferase
MFYSTHYASPLGKMTLGCHGDSIVGLWLEGQKYFGDTIPEALVVKEDPQVFAKTKNWLDRYFAGEKPKIAELPLAPIGSEFRQAVWKLLCEIPYGEVTTYGSIAKKLAVQLRKDSISSQAVGGAVGHNPISVIIPCHRVVGADGSLTGYAGGIGKKVKLLELEGADMSHLYIPKRGTAL